MFNAQQFAARLADRADRWSLLIDFVAEWHSPLQEGDGYSPKELDAAEQRLGLKLPIALREWYQMAGRRKDLTATQNFLRSPDRLFIQEENGSEILYFYTEAQAVVNWGVPLDKMGLNDPPIILDEWGEIENQTLSEFITQMVVLETTCFGSFGGNASATPEALETVRHNFVLLGFPEWHWPAYPSRLYGGSDLLIETEEPQDGASWIWIGARNQVALRQAAQQLALDWETLNLE